MKLLPFFCNELILNDTALFVKSFPGYISNIYWEIASVTLSPPPKIAPVTPPPNLRRKLFHFENAVPEIEEIVANEENEEIHGLNGGEWEGGSRNRRNLRKRRRNPWI